MNIKELNNLDINFIKGILPHRDPFLLVDEIIHCKPGEYIHAIKHVKIDESYFKGHFPKKPIMPGVLIIESLAQAGGFLVLNDIGDPKKKLMYLSGIKQARFKRVVQPPSELHLKAQLKKIKLGTCIISGQAFVDNELVAQADLIATIVDRS